MVCPIWSLKLFLQAPLSAIELKKCQFMNNSKSKNTGPWIPNNQSIEIYILKDDKYALHAFADATEKVLEGLEVL